MAIPRLRIDETALLVIDLQESLLRPVIDRHRVVSNSTLLIKVGIELAFPILVTELYPQRLGRTVDRVSAVMIDPAARIEKTAYSATGDLLIEMLQRWRRSSVLVCGIESHVCVLQTVLDLQAAGHQAFVVADAVSSSQPDQTGHALRRMEAAGAVTTSVMSATYELLGEIGHPSRRACVALMRELER
jgi:nicotinamidase-related amidase